MSRKLVLLAMAGVVGLAGVVPVALAADGEGAPPPAQQKAPAPRAGEVTHAELAKILVNLLALSRFLPPDPSAQQCFGILLQNEIAPPDGWKQDAVVTKGDLAVVLVKCLKAMGEQVDIDANDIKQAMQYLKEQGIPIDTIGEGVSVVEPLANPVAVQVFAPTSDPLEKRQKFSSTDEQESGADAERDTTGPIVAVTEEEVAQIIVTVPKPSGGGENPPPTPFRPLLGAF